MKKRTFFVPIATMSIYGLILVQLIPYFEINYVHPDTRSMEILSTQTDQHNKYRYWLNKDVISSKTGIQHLWHTKSDRPRWVIISFPATYLHRLCRMAMTYRSTIHCDFLKNAAAALIFINLFIIMHTHTKSIKKLPTYSLLKKI